MVALSSIASAFGDWHDLDAYDESGVLFDALLADGFERFAVSKDDVTALALSAAQQTLEAWPHDRESISAFIFFTDEVGDLDGRNSDKAILQHHRLRKRLFDGLAALGLKCAYPMGVWLSGCSNALAALLQAKSLIDAGLARHVLVLGGDRSPHGQTRITGRADAPLGIRSDGGVAFVASADGPIALCGSALIGNLEIIQPYEQHLYGEYMVGMGRSLMQLRERFDAGHTLSAGSYDVVTTANYLSSAVATYLMPCGLALGKLGLPTKAGGHNVCSDILRNIEILTETSPKVLTFWPSAFGWALAAFERH